MRKRITSALLTLVMLLSLVPAMGTTAAAEGTRPAPDRVQSYIAAPGFTATALNPNQAKFTYVEIFSNTDKDGTKDGNMTATVKCVTVDAAIANKIGYNGGNAAVDSEELLSQLKDKLKASKDYYKPSSKTLSFPANTNGVRHQDIGKGTFRYLLSVEAYFNGTYYFDGAGINFVTRFREAYQGEDKYTVSVQVCGMTIYPDTASGEGDPPTKLKLVIDNQIGREFTNTNAAPEGNYGIRNYPDTYVANFRWICMPNTDLEIELRNNTVLHVGKYFRSSSSSAETKANIHADNLTISGNGVLLASNFNNLPYGAQGTAADSAIYANSLTVDSSNVVLDLTRDDSYNCIEVPTPSAFKPINAKSIKLAAETGRWIKDLSNTEQSLEENYSAYWDTFTTGVTGSRLSTVTFGRTAGLSDAVLNVGSQEFKRTGAVTEDKLQADGNAQALNIKVRAPKWLTTLKNTDRYDYNYTAAVYENGTKLSNTFNLTTGGSSDGTSTVTLTLTGDFKPTAGKSYIVTFSIKPKVKATGEKLDSAAISCNWLLTAVEKQKTFLSEVELAQGGQIFTDHVNPDVTVDDAAPYEITEKGTWAETASGSGVYRCTVTLKIKDAASYGFMGGAKVTVTGGGDVTATNGSVKGAGDTMTTTLTAYRYYQVKFGGDAAARLIRAGTGVDAPAYTGTVEEGKEFKGWQAGEGGTIYAPGTTIFPDKDMTLTAVFEDLPETSEPVYQFSLAVGEDFKPRVQFEQEEDYNSTGTNTDLTVTVTDTSTNGAKLTGLTAKFSDTKFNGNNKWFELYTGTWNSDFKEESALTHELSALTFNETSKTATFGVHLSRMRKTAEDPYSNKTMPVGHCYAIIELTATYEGGEVKVYADHEESAQIIDTAPTFDAPGSWHTECEVCGEQMNTGAIAKLVKIDVANLTVAKPVKDVAAAEATTTDNAYYVADTEWVAADGTTLAIGEKFQPGTAYTVKITLETAGDGVFSAASAYNQIAGKTATVSPALTGNGYTDTVILTYTFDATEGAYVPTAPSISTATLPDGKVGEAYNQLLSANGSAPITWSIESGNLPDGLTLNSANGTISGTPSKTGDFKFTVKATNVGGSDTKELTIKITDTEAAKYHNVTITGAGTGATGAGSHAADTTVNIYAGTKSGYTFDGWTSDDVTILSASSKNASFVMPDKDVTVKANWTYNGGGSGGGGYTYYTIKATAGVNGSISPSGNVSVREGRDQTFTITPDKGYAVSKVLIDSKNVGAVKSYTFENVKKNHTIEVVFMKAGGNPQTGVFVDVPEDSYYEEAVNWAVENGITTGTDATHFTPDGICTRAQAVTFLWRAAGSPAPKSTTMPFTDVKAGSYYYDAVLWAVENGITKGTSATEFSPAQNCSRAQIVTFLWRSEKSPAAGTVNPFTDVKSDAYYADAVLWAVKEDVTKGTTATTFSPNANCTRAQIVTFIWRALAE